MAPERWLVLLLATQLGSACSGSKMYPQYDNDEDEGSDAVPAPADARERPDAGATIPPGAGDAGVRPDAAPGCGSLTEDGACGGSTLTWCQGNQVMTQDCAQSGQSCQCSGGWCECASGGGLVIVVDYCDGLTSSGQCWNGYLQYCDGLGVVTVDCWSSGLYCECPFFGDCDCYY